MADCERTVSVAAGEAVPAAGLAVARALPVPPQTEGLGRALGEGEAEAGSVAEGETVAMGERVAVEERERTVSVAREEVDTQSVAEGGGEPLSEEELLREAAGVCEALEVTE